MALAMAKGATGTPSPSQTDATGPTSAVVSRLLSQLLFIQVMTLGRKLPLDNLQRHGMSMPLQVTSPDCLMQST